MSWNRVHSWYNKLVGIKGHEYHRHVIFPQLLEKMRLQEGDRLLDLACGQGVLARVIPTEVKYSGFDASEGLLTEAKAKGSLGQSFKKANISEPLKVEGTFSHAAMILALQNLENPEGAFENAAQLLETGGRFFIVMNHPYFRIPKQTFWGVDRMREIQYRQVNSYMSSRKIPILMNPSKGHQSKKTFSYHHPLSAYVQMLKKVGLAVVDMDEWCSHKKSEGGMAKIEDRARDEFPLFLYLEAVKL